MKKKYGKGFVIQYIMQPFKGQLIPKGFFDVIVSTNENFLKISALASKKRLDQKNKGTLYH